MSVIPETIDFETMQRDRAYLDKAYERKSRRSNILLSNASRNYTFTRPINPEAELSRFTKHSQKNKGIQEIYM